MSSRSKQIIYPLLVLAIFGLGIALLMLNKKTPEKKSFEKRAPIVATETIQTGDIQLQVTSQGVVEPRYRTQLVAQVTGEIVSISDVFVRGGIVEQGQLLAQIDPFNYQVKWQQAQANLASARAAFILERAQGQVAEAEWAKISSATPSELGLRKPQQEQALANVKAAEAALTQAKKDLDRTRIIAPYKAIVELRSVSPGGFVNIGTPIGTLAEVAQAEIRLPVEKSDFAYLENNAINATVTLQTEFAGQSFTRPAQIIRSEGVIDANSRMIYLVAQIDDPYNLKSPSPSSLPFGSFVTASIAGKSINNAVRIPRALLRNNQVPTAIDTTLHFKDVVVARHEGKTTIISSGLSNGDQIIITALDHPVEGMEIKLKTTEVSVTGAAQ